MSFRYTIQKISKNGAVDTRTETFDKTEIVVGRGSGSDILLESSFVSLAHAKLTLHGSELDIEDLGSLSGVKVNDRLVSQSRLKAGDSIRVGDIQLTVTSEGGAWGVKEERVEAEKVDVEAQVKADMERITLGSRLPSYAILALLCSAAVAIVFFALPMSGSKKSTWSSGPISNKHAAFEADCESCHMAPFTPVKSESCLNCHKMSNHAELMPAGHKLEGNCTTCHIEHEGDHGLTARKEDTCTRCHANIQGIDPKAKSENVPSFAKHPEFDKHQDLSHVKLNHEVHLKGPIRSNDGMKSLNCRSCHEFEAEGRSIEPVNYKKHCADCHSLGFDDRMPDKAVPHGNSSDEILKFLNAEYASFLSTSQKSLDVGQIAKESREAEQMLFTKTACQLCHDVKERSETTPGEIVAQNKSRYEIIATEIPDSWMKNARFDHSAHDAVQCESCHKSARSSTKTSDVLLPGLAKCTTCHADPTEKHSVRSDCTMCHSYHDKLPLEAAYQRKIEELISKH